MTVRLSYCQETDVLIVVRTDRIPGYTIEDALDAGFTFERFDRDTEEIVGYEFYDLTTYHRQGDGWDLPMEEPDIEFQVVDGPDKPMKLLELLDWALANREKIRWRPSA